MSIMITGGSGLIGSEIQPSDDTKKYFKPKHSELELLDYNQLKEYCTDNKISEIIHLAAKVGGVKGNQEHMLDFFTHNLAINANIIRICSELNIQRCTFLLSTCVFPHHVSYPVDETSVHNGEPHFTNYGYAYAKRMLEVGARCLREKKGTIARCIIPCNVYGINDNYHLDNGHVIPSLIHKCYLAKINNTPFHIWGKGIATREFMFAKDIAKAIQLIHSDERQISDLMIVSPCISHSIGETANIIAESFDYRGEIVYDDSKPEGILHKPTLNSRFISHYPNFEFTNFNSGIKQACDFVQNHYDLIRK